MPRQARERAVGWLRRTEDDVARTLPELADAGLIDPAWAEALVMLSATPINLRNRDLFNLLSLLVPGEFEDLDSLEERLAPNRVLHRLTRSLADPTATNTLRRAWLEELSDDVFGELLTLRPD